MIFAEYLIRVEKEALAIVSSTIREINGGYVKVVKEEENTVTIAIGENPEKINLPQKIHRIKIENDHSCWEQWGVRKEKKNGKENNI